MKHNQQWVKIFQLEIICLMLCNVFKDKEYKNEIKLIYNVELCIQ